MRRLTIVLVGVLLSVGLAMSASALSVDPNPINFAGNTTSGSVSFAVDGAKLSMEIQIDTGKLSKSRVSVADSGGDRRTVLSAGSIDGAGVNVKRVRISKKGEVEFAFKSSFFHTHIQAGETSDVHFVVYDNLAVGDVITWEGFRHDIFGSFGSANATIVPEPSTAVLVGLGIVGLAVAGRRR